MTLPVLTLLCTAPALAADLVAAWYGAECAGRRMANGQRFNPRALVAASWDHPLGTRLRITHHSRSVVVTVTDRGPARRLLGTRQIDLSREAFSRLANPNQGLINITTHKLP